MVKEAIIVSYDHPYKNNRESRDLNLLVPSLLSNVNKLNLKKNTCVL